MNPCTPTNTAGGSPPSRAGIGVDLVGHAGGGEAGVLLGDRPRTGDGERRLALAEALDHHVVA